MKILSFFLVLAAASASAQAATLSLSTPGVPNLFRNAYILDSFKVASDSSALGGLGEITSGNVAINEGTKELRLTLQRRMSCPEGQMCIMMMPVPTVITLPIQTIRHDACGGTTIVAERALQVVGGGHTRIEVLDPNGASLACPGGGDNATFVKRVKVVITEKSTRDDESEISVLSGVPAQR